MVYFLWIGSLYTEASLGPYAWQYKQEKHVRRSHRAKGGPNPENLPLEGSSEVGEDTRGHVLSQSIAWKDIYLQHDDLAWLPRSQDVFRKIEKDPYLSLDIPKPGATAGVVLQHSINLFQKLLEANKPMSFKFGITHDPAIRWHNSTFGYKVSKERFQHLIAIYAASNPHGPAFLEAALIDRFGSFLLAQSHDTYLVFLSGPWQSDAFPMCPFSMLMYMPSTKACRGAKMNVGVEIR